MEQILHDYGWYAVLILFLIDKVWPALVKRFDKERDANLKREEEERANRRRRDDDDRRWNHDMMERLTAAIENLARTMPEMNLRMATVQRNTEQTAHGVAILLERISAGE